MVFTAVSQVLLSWYKDKYKKLNLIPGFILTLHTFGRDGKWNVHIHCLLSEHTIDNYCEKKIDLPEQDIGKSKFIKIKNIIYSNYNNGFYVRAKKSEFLNSKAAISYILHYCGSPCFTQYRIIDIEQFDFILFWYQRHEDNLYVVERIHIFEFITRLIRHIPEPQFKTIRYYGFYASRKHKL